ncbi:MAG: hypothetical protein AAGF94_14690 [Pseudomonadota bacterium]
MALPVAGKFEEGGALLFTGPADIIAASPAAQSDVVDRHDQVDDIVFGAGQVKRLETTTWQIRANT